MKDQITIHGHDGAFRAYIATPEALPAPAVVVLHEVFGVNDDIRKTCDELSEKGFIAAAPDLFWRQEPGVDLSVTSEADWQHGLRLYQAFDRDAGVVDVKETADAVVKLPECTGKVAVLGYCLGGLMTFLTASGSACQRANRRVSKSTTAATRSVPCLQSRSPRGLRYSA
jgi:carboxymethylenebutenolidase